MTKATISEDEWVKIRQRIEAGERVVDLAREYEITAARISARKKKWEQAAYFKDAKYAKFHTEAYKKWRLAVFAKDKNKCIICGRGKPSVILQADHIKSWALYPELRFAVSNGRVLCVYHHRRTLNFGRKGGSYTNEDASDNDWIIKEKILWKLKKQTQSVKKLLKKKRKTKS